MSAKERNQEIVESVLQQIKREEETRKILTGEYLDKYNFMKYITPFSGTENASSVLRTCLVIGAVLVATWAVLNISKA